MIAKPHQLLHSFADLHKRLGEVPLHRIRMNPFPGSATEADLETAKGPTCELIDGVLVEKAMGDRESAMGLFLGRRIGDLVENENLGITLGADGFIKLDDGLIRTPDVTFIPWDSFPDEEVPEEAYWSVTPGLIVEVLSPTNTKAEIERKLHEFFLVGCKLAWVVDPETQTARIMTSPTRVKLLSAKGVLDGGKILPGFRLPLAEVFAVLDRRKKKSR